MEIDMKEDRREKFIEVPSYLPRLFVAPSCLPKFALVLESMAEMKATLSRKTVDLKESMYKREQEYVEKLYEECCSLSLEIECLENEANVMRKELVQRIYLEVRSEKEMMAVNDLMSSRGVGAAPGMQCFGGKIGVGEYLPNDVVKAIAIAQRSGKSFKFASI